MISKGLASIRSPGTTAHPRAGLQCSYLTYPTNPPDPQAQAILGLLSHMLELLFQNFMEAELLCVQSLISRAFWLHLDLALALHSFTGSHILFFVSLLQLLSITLPVILQSVTCRNVVCFTWINTYLGVAGYVVGVHLILYKKLPSCSLSWWTILVLQFSVCVHSWCPAILGSVIPKDILTTVVI